MSSKGMVMVIYNAPVLPKDHVDSPGERAVLETVDAVMAALENAGYEVHSLGIDNDPKRYVDTMMASMPDCVFNLFEGTGDRPELESIVTGVLDWFKIPFTGCPALSQVIGRDKVRTKLLLQGAKLSTAEFLSYESAEVTMLPQSWPVFVKPGGTDASQGIDQGSVIGDEAALRIRVTELLQRYGPPVLVEEFLPGPEFNVGVVELPELTALPVAELVFTPQPGIQWNIISYDSKWKPGSTDDLAMLPRIPAEISEELRQQLCDLAKQAFKLLACKDYARIDFRLDKAGRPCILEVNPNPDLGSDAGLAKMLRAAGMGYEGFVTGMVANNLPPPNPLNPLPHLATRSGQ